MQITQELKDQIVQMYVVEHQGATTISRILGLSEHGIKYNLKKQGIQIRNIKEYRQFTLNENYFETIDTPDKAYWLGFLYADGYNHEARGEVKLCLNRDDRQHIEAFQEAIGSNQPIKEHASNRRNNTVQIVLNSRKFSEDLARHGCGQKKSFKIRMPDFLTDETRAAFMLGYFDGDGCITVNAIQFSITSAYDFCLDYQNVLMTYAELNRTKLYTKKITAHRPLREKAWAMKYSGRGSIRKIYDYLYSVPVTVCLLRKKRKFEEILTNEKPAQEAFTEVQTQS